MIVRAGGFAEWTESVEPSREVSVVLKLAPLLETVTVTPTRSEKRWATSPSVRTSSKRRRFDSRRPS